MCVLRHQAQHYRGPAAVRQDPDGLHPEGTVHLCKLQHSQHPEHGHTGQGGPGGRPEVILSLCCTSLIYYKGTGHEFNTACGPRCVRENQFSKGRTLFQQGSSKALTTCFVCQQKNVVNSFDLLHVPTRSIQPYHLCSRHNLGTEIVKTLGDEYDLVKALKCNKKLTSARRPENA